LKLLRALRVDRVEDFGQGGLWILAGHDAVVDIERNLIDSVKGPVRQMFTDGGYLPRGLIRGASAVQCRITQVRDGLVLAGPGGRPIGGRVARASNDPPASWLTCGRNTYAIPRSIISAVISSSLLGMLGAITTTLLCDRSGTGTRRRIRR
jgi:hypothetical protein